PLLMFASCEACGGQVNDAVVGAAAAVELVHTYSLVHDDLPCMDDDTVRRGQPTVHVAFDEGTAVLVGDALLTEAFRVLATLPGSGAVRARLVEELATAAGHLGMIGGQALDLGLGGTPDTTEALLRLHRHKTGALIQWSVRTGGLLAEADEPSLAALSEVGETLGLAFQVADDLRDADQDAGLDGSPSLVEVTGMESTRLLAHDLRRRALDAIERLPRPSALEALARFIVERDH
ncbi:MAG: polyprenyl synthetase family protein, partial [Myxococcota bacterium]|nr:polyprenyl synthetase family protein [Myxococcota bacterium]